jgi:hypothetical protein
MLKINNFSKLIIVVFSVVALSLILFSGCTDEKEVVKTEIVVEKDTVFVSIIAVDAINASMDSVTQGLPIVLTVQITKGAQAGDVTINWFATGGSFNTQTGDTVTWTAPDDPGVYTISAHATDGEFIGYGARMVGVGMYVPTVTPYFLGDEACSQCHQGTHDDWALTNHSHAWETLQNSGHPASYCNPCHAVGFEPSPNTGNSGYDEAPIEKFVNVQCENCHSPGSDHATGPTSNLIDISFDVMNCGICHEGTHHPFLTEWEQSPHNFDPYSSAHGAGVNGGCQGCHEGFVAAKRLSGDLSAFYGGAPYGTPARDTTIYEGFMNTWAIPNPPQGVVCQTCHDPHNVDNPAQLRTVADIPLVTANGESPVITIGGSGKLCMHCHHARRGPDDQVINGYDHFGPHANPQADMMRGASAYHGVADPNFVWATPSHLNVENSCKTCHLAMREFGEGPDGAAVVGHEFIPKPEACGGCHGEITDFDEIPALDDFDGDGTVEGVQSEVDGLAELLEEILIDSLEALNLGIDTNDPDFDLAHYLGSVDSSTFRMREAGYNWVFIEDDKSHGVHNPDYAVQLLQQSILHIGGTLPQPAAIVRNENEVVGNW